MEVITRLMAKLLKMNVKEGDVMMMICHLFSLQDLSDGDSAALQSVDDDPAGVVVSGCSRYVQHTITTVG